MKKIKIESIMFVGILLFSILMTLYLFSSEGTFGISGIAWRSLYVVFFCLILISFSIFMICTQAGIIKTLSKYVLLPFFIFLMIYLFFRMSEIYIFDEFYWRLILIAPFLAGILTTIFDRKKWQREM